MHAKEKRRRVEKLVEKYAQRRNIEANQDEEGNDLFDCQASCSFTPLLNVPGVFSADGLVEGFELLKRYFPDLALSVLPLIQLHLPANQIPCEKSNEVKARQITNVEEWISLKPQLEKLCPMMLPFVAQLVKIDESTSLHTEEKIKLESGCNQSFMDPKTRQHLIQLKVRNKDKTSVTAYANISSVIKRKRAYIHSSKVNKIVSLPFIKDIFLSNDSNGITALWDGTNGIKLRKFVTRDTSCNDISLCEHMHITGLFISAHADGGARIWMMDRTNYLRLLVHDYPVKQVALRDRTAVTSTEFDRAVRIWDINTGEIVRVLEQMDTECLAIKFVDDQKIWALAESGIMYLSDIDSATTLAKHKLDIALKSKVTSMSVVLHNSTSLLLATNYLKLFCVDLNCSNQQVSMFKVNCLVVDNEMLENCPILATKWSADQQKIFIVFG
uniref:Uncharacterized protein n=1 Tax=Ditylenchus dipsaci TaxID=166011 RepID=A0A915D091_9BILA